MRTLLLILVNGPDRSNPCSRLGRPRAKRILATLDSYDLFGAPLLMTVRRARNRLNGYNLVAFRLVGTRHLESRLLRLRFDIPAA
jgi:hypothetical protein